MYFYLKVNSFRLSLSLVILTIFLLCSVQQHNITLFANHNSTNIEKSYDKTLYCTGLVNKKIYNKAINFKQYTNKYSGTSMLSADNEHNVKRTQVLIIGSGPAGCSAAIYAARANLQPIMVAGRESGGQLMITTDVENYPGFSKPIQGPELMDQMHEQVRNVGGVIVNDHISAVDFHTSPFKVVGSENIYYADSVIICTGAQAKWLNIPSESKFKGYGVSGCATCDGFFYRGKKVIVVGGGNTAVEEALYLTNHTNQVTLLHRRDSLRADKTLQARLFKKVDEKKINIIWNSVIDEVLGSEDSKNKAVTGVKIKNIIDNTISELSCEGVFIAIGHTPNTSLFASQLNIDAAGYIITKPNSTATSIDGVFAAGDVQDSIYRQAVTAASSGCMAALEAEKFLSEDKIK